MSDFISCSGTQHAMPSPNAGTDHAISELCLSQTARQLGSFGLHPLRKHSFLSRSKNGLDCFYLCFKLSKLYPEHV